MSAYLSTESVQHVDGGNRTGKTELSVAKSIHYATGIHPTLSMLRQPPVYGRYVCVNWDEGVEVVLKKFKSMVRRDDLFGHSWDKGWSQGRGVLQFCLDKRKDVPGSRISFLTSQQSVQAHAGDDLDWVVMDEHHEFKYFVENRARLVDRGGFLMLTMTPDFGMTWEQQEIIDKVNAGVPGFAHWNFDMRKNPHLSKDGVAQMVEALKGDPELFKAKVMGQMVALTGLVYPMFKPEIHVIDDERVPLNLLTHRAVVLDPHLKKPAAMLWGGWTKEGEAYLYREARWSPNAGGIKDLATLIRVRTQGEKIDDWIMDEALGGNPDEESVNAFGEKPMIVQLNEAGLPFVGTNMASDKDVRAGILKMRSLLVPDGSTGRPRLFVARSCTGLIREFQQYQFRKLTPVDDEQYRERLRNIDDDLVTCARYFAMAEPFWNMPKHVPQMNYDPDSGVPTYGPPDPLPGLEV